MTGQPRGEIRREDPDPAPEAGGEPTPAGPVDGSSDRAPSEAGAGDGTGAVTRYRRNRRRRRLSKQLRWGLTIFAVLLVVEYLVLPQVAGARKSLDLLRRVNVWYLIAGAILEAGALMAYAELTHTVLPAGGPDRWRILRINTSSLAVSHVIPGGTAPATGVAYRLLTDVGVDGPDAAFGLAMQGVGSAVVLNVVLWLALIVSIFMRGYNPLYGVAAGVGVLLMAAFGAVVLLLLRGRDRAVEVVRQVANRVPFLDGETLARDVRRIAERLRSLLGDRALLRAAILWAAVNWLLDAASLWVFIAAFHHLVNPVDLLVAYGLANVLAAIPVTPGGLGVVEGTLIATLAGFGVPRHAAILSVLAYRLFNFWLPIPLGGAAYVSLRRTAHRGWRHGLDAAREDVAAHQGAPDPVSDVVKPPPHPPSAAAH